MKNGGQGRLTSVLHPLLRLWTPYQTEGWEWPRPGATTSAPGSFGFGDTVAGVPSETGLLWAGVSVQCRPPRCEPRVAGEAGAPCCFAAPCFLVDSLCDPRRARSVPGSAIENLRYRRRVVWAPLRLHRAACRCLVPGQDRVSVCLDVHTLSPWMWCANSWLLAQTHRPPHRPYGVRFETSSHTDRLRCNDCPITGKQKKKTKSSESRWVKRL